MKVNDIIKVNIVNYDKDGKGVAYYNDHICFIKNALINEFCLIKITKFNKKVILGEVVEIITKSDKRIDSDCKYYLRCGGCGLRHISYETELEVKYNKVVNAFNHIAQLKDITICNVVKADNLYHYRNKAIIPFQKNKNDIIYGMYENNSHKIVNIDNCLIEQELLGSVLVDIKEYLIKNNISIYDEQTHKGLFRGIMLRNNYKKEFMLVFIVTSNCDFMPLVAILSNKYNNIISYYLNINKNNNNVMLAYDNIHLIKEKYLYENILDNNFEVSVNTFLQINHEQTEKLYKLGLSLLNLNKDDIVLDCFCGMGSITLSLARMVKKVYGIEIVDVAIKNAIANAKRNNINNAYFECGKCEDLIDKYIKEIHFTKVVFDPPRKGCELSFLKAILKAEIKTILYISCNVATLARDVKILSEKYEVKKIIPVDLFPRTEHVEVVCLLELI